MRDYFGIAINYVRALGTTTTFELLPISWLTFTLSVLAGLFVICFLVREKTGRRFLSQIAASSLFVSLSFAVFLGLRYVFHTNQNDAEFLASYARYMSTGLMGILVFVLYALTHASKEYEFRNRRLMRILLVVIIIGSLGFSAFLLRRQVIANTIESRTIPFAEENAALFYADPENDKVYIVYQNTARYQFSWLHYLSYPLQLNQPISIPFRVDDYGDLSQLYYNVNTHENWQRSLIRGNYTHVYMHALNYLISDEIAPMIVDGSKPESFTLYRVVVSDEGDVGLVKVLTP